MGDTASIPLIKMALKQRKSLGDSVNRKLMRDFRLYMLIGGMPQAVEEYIETNDFNKVDQIKRNILELYEEDFRKIDPTGRASMFFKAIPSQVSKNVSWHQVSSVVSNSRPSTVTDLIAEMADSMTINISYHANNVGMALNKDFNRFKLFLADTGLFVTLAFMDTQFTDNIIY